MPVFKYRSIEEMASADELAEAGPGRPSAEEGLRMACELSELAYRLKPWAFEPGVHKFRSIEEAQEARRAWRREQARRPRAARD